MNSSFTCTVETQWLESLHICGSIVAGKRVFGIPPCSVFHHVEEVGLCGHLKTAHCSPSSDNSNPPETVKEFQVGPLTKLYANERINECKCT